MEDLLRQIELSLENNLYYLALFSILTLPDMCGAIDSIDGKASESNYINWFDKYVTPKYDENYLDGEVVYKYRCSTLHQGTSSHPKNKYARLMFFEPAISDKVNLRFEGRHVLVLKGVDDNDSSLMLDLKIFCLAIIEATNEWLSEKKDDDLLKKNMYKFIKRYPFGTGGLFGAPIIS